MNKLLLFLLVTIIVCSIVISEQSSSSVNWLSKKRADTLYCSINGNCINLSNINSTILDIINDNAFWQISDIAGIEPVGSSAVTIENTLYTQSVSPILPATYSFGMPDGRYLHGYFMNGYFDTKLKMTDNAKLYFGLSEDTSIYFDVVNLIINPKELGTGIVKVLGSVNISDELCVNNTCISSFGNVTLWEDNGDGTISPQDNNNITVPKIQVTSCTSEEVMVGTTGNCINFNDTVQDIFDETQVIYNATNITTEVGTLDGGNLLSIQNLDAEYYNVSEVSGVPGFAIYVNFTNVTAFNVVALRGKYDGGAGHTVELELYRVGVGWEERESITDQLDFGVTTFDVFEGGNFIHPDGTVQFRIYHDDNGVISHDYYLDYLVIGQVSGIVVGGDLSDLTGRDAACTLLPEVFCKDGSKPVEGNLNVTGNATATYFIGNGSLLTNVGSDLWQDNGNGLISPKNNNNISTSRLNVDYINMTGVRIGTKTTVTTTGVAIGHQAVSDIGVSIGAGVTSTAAGITMGENSIGRGAGDIVMGLYGLADYGTTDSIVMGDTAFTSGSDSISMGSNSNTSANHAIAMGFYSKASGSQSLALGRESYTNDTNSIAIGYQAQALADNCIAIGANVVCNQSNTLKLGSSSIEMFFEQGTINGNGNATFNKFCQYGTNSCYNLTTISTGATLWTDNGDSTISPTNNNNLTNVDKITGLNGSYIRFDPDGSIGFI